MMSKVRSLLIDDEPLARQIIRDFLSDYEDIVIVGECTNGFDGFKQIQELQPDLVFLDVMMPKLTGFEMLELIESPPVVVFSTAYDEYAIKAFELNALDYLLKPYSKERFHETLKKVIEKFQTPVKIKRDFRKVGESVSENQSPLSRIAVKIGSKIHIIPSEEIKYIKAQDDYVEIYCDKGRFLKQNTMKYYEAHLPKDEFVRIHRSYIVSLRSITRMEPMGKDTHVLFLEDETRLPVSRSHYSDLKKVLNL